MGLSEVRHKLRPDKKVGFQYYIAKMLDEKCVYLTVMLPAHFDDVTNDISRSGNQIWCRSQTQNTRAI